jgi:hypothetical protein
MTIKGKTTLAGLFVIAGLVLFVAACGNEPDISAPERAGTEGESFTFFNIGKNARMNGTVRDDLKKILGDVAVERRGIVDLTINYPTFLQEHFPELDRMNRALNSDIGLRVKHRITRLMYRYAKQKGLPYDLVEFIFAEKTTRPILIRLHFKADIPGSLKTLEEKYGLPQTFTWGRENASSQVWQRDGDYLFYSVIPRRGNKVEYRIAIYFTAAIEDLIRVESEMQKTETQGKTGF